MRTQEIAIGNKSSWVTGLWALVCCLLAIVLIRPVRAMQPGMDLKCPQYRFCVLPVDKSGVMTLDSKTQRIAVGNPGIADIKMLDDTHLYVLGLRLGTTNVTLWSPGRGYFDTIQLEVTHDLDGLKAKLHELYPNEHPKIYSSQGSIVLSGQVSSLEKMNAILSIARTFVHKGAEPPSAFATGTTSLNVTQGATGGTGVGAQPGASPSAPQGQDTGVINLMQVGGPQQVMLAVTVAEINRTLARRLKVDFSAIGATGDFSAGAVSGTALVDALTRGAGVASSVINPYGLFFKFIGNDVAVKTVINASKENGLAKVLAEPTLTTISGQDAEFRSGGEFPIPVPQTIAGGTAGTITVQFKEFGVGVNFLPVVLDSGHISLNLNVSVSELSPANSVVIPIGNTTSSFAVPSLTKRSARSSLELDDGQTLGIAGLISDNTRNNINKFPGLGDIPILGQLFTSQDFLKNQTELLIFVTPRLAKPIATDKVKLPTDYYVEPDDIEFYLMGRTEGRSAPAARPRVAAPAPQQGGMSGNFGQQP